MARRREGPEMPILRVWPPPTYYWLNWPVRTLPRAYSARLAQRAVGTLTRKPFPVVLRRLRLQLGRVPLVATGVPLLIYIQNLAICTKGTGSESPQIQTMKVSS